MSLENFVLKSIWVVQNYLLCYGKPFYGLFLSIFFNQAKLIYNNRSHAKGDCQNFKIEEVEEL